MEIAIMGAGLSGLSTAIILEQNGIYPYIFEKKQQVGDRFVNCEIFLSALTRPVSDHISYLAEEYKIYLKPTSNIKKLIIHSENRQAGITGQLGFTNLRGRDINSFEKQLARQVKSKIFFNSNYTYEQLLKEFSHIIVATGDADYAAKIQHYQKDVTVTLKGAIITGKFNRYTVRAWLNNHLAPLGYGYLIPITDKKANIVIAYPEYTVNKPVDVADLWKRYYHEVCRILDQNLKIVSEFEINKYIIGICQAPRIGNTFFTGNNFGSIMPFLGFGQFAAILTGVYAAKDLSSQGDYLQLTNSLKKSYYNSLTLRKAIEKMSNPAFDLLVSQLNGYPGRLLFNRNKPDFLKLASYLLRPFLKFRDK